MTRIQELIDTLQGTCKSLEQGCQDCGFTEDSLTSSELEDLDAEIFLCESCGWWYERSEESERNEGDCIECDE